MDVPIDRLTVRAASDDITRSEAIAAAFQRAIAEGRLVSGQRLLPIRRLSTELGVSGATVAAAYGLLQARGWTRGEVGRGTFVVGRPDGAANGANVGANSAGARTTHSYPVSVPRAPWRRRAMVSSAARLVAAHPMALDCTSGKPDPDLILKDIVVRSWRAALDETDNADLQYANPEPAGALVRALWPRLERDAISVTGAELVVGSSAQQLMVLSVSIAAAMRQAAPRIVAVEEPGYQTVFDAFERMGFRLVGMAIDDEGVVPESLEQALSAGAQVALFTPRAQNPFGASWSAGRRRALARILGAYPDTVVIEDDQFADLAAASPGSLLNEPQLAERVIYIRSFAKAIAPDMRLAVALARPRLRNLLVEAKSFTDGWSPRLSQRALSHLLADPDIDAALESVRRNYAARRSAAIEILSERLASVGTTVHGGDGLNIWVPLAPGVDAAEVVERAAALGVLLSSGEPFFIRPGHNDAIRMSVSSVSTEEARWAADRVAEAVLTTATVPAIPIPI